MFRGLREKDTAARDDQPKENPLLKISNLVPEWYHLRMAMNLRLSDNQTQALREFAAREGISMQEAALTAIDEYLSQRNKRLKSAIERIKSEDKELLDRLAQ